MMNGEWEPGGWVGGTPSFYNICLHPVGLLPDDTGRFCLQLKFRCIGVQPFTERLAIRSTA
jgi:hypothetical protein